MAPASLSPGGICWPRGRPRWRTTIAAAELAAGLDRRARLVDRLLALGAVTCDAFEYARPQTPPTNAVADRRVHAAGLDARRLASQPRMLDTRARVVVVEVRPRREHLDEIEAVAADRRARCRCVETFVVKQCVDSPNRVTSVPRRAAPEASASPAKRG